MSFDKYQQQILSDKLFSLINSFDIVITDFADAVAELSAELIEATEFHETGVFSDSENIQYDLDNIQIMLDKHKEFLQQVITGYTGAETDICKLFELFYKEKVRTYI